ncbi:hypothetical protein ACFQX4_14370 [Roseomonas sp. GCM10028921]
MIPKEIARLQSRAALYRSMRFGVSQQRDADLLMVMAKEADDTAATLAAALQQQAQAWVDDWRTGRPTDDVHDAVEMAA